MKQIIKTAAYFILAIVAAGCAKTVSVGPNDANKRYFDAWMEMNHPGLKPTGLGIYVLEEERGLGNTVLRDGFVFADYVVTDLEGNILDYTGKNTAKQLGQYDTTYYYGPLVMTTFDQTLPAGVMSSIIGMMEGGRKKVIIPSWLMSYYSYNTEEEYLAESTSSSNLIYDITIRAFTDSISKYEIEQIEKYIQDNPKTFDKKVVNDTTGFYFMSRSDVTTEEKFANDTSIFINYTGKLLNGLVFDTTIEKIAKDNGLYNSSKTYEPVEIFWAEEHSGITMGDSESNVKDGFSRILWHMHPNQPGQKENKAIGVFYSSLGYGSSGSGNSIPGYAPLIFEIEIVDKPEE